ncbi:MAG TPA: lysophospholipid acyltransferase family protein [Streptosporangiaceae bacterium]
MGHSELASPGSWRHLLADLAEFARRRLAGEYEVDEFGFDPDLNAAVFMPVALVLYREWFRVQLRGLEHVPDTGPALIVANHSGVLPLDAIMLQAGVYADHSAHRHLRLLGADLVYELPLLRDMARKSGHTRASPGCAGALLRAGELVGVFPEGFKGIGKPFSERYRLQRFGRGGFARTAIGAGVPIIPCAIVGAEEIYPMIGNAARTARLLRLPYFPVTPLFPWLGPLGAVPLPSNWIIEFCEPVPVPELAAGASDDESDDEADDWADDSLPDRDDEVVTELAGHVRGVIQAKLDDLVADRGPAFS